MRRFFIFLSLIDSTHYCSSSWRPPSCRPPAASTMSQRTMLVLQPTSTRPPREEGTPRLHPSARLAGDVADGSPSQRTAKRPARRRMPEGGLKHPSLDSGWPSHSPGPGTPCVAASIGRQDTARHHYVNTLSIQDQDTSRTLKIHFHTFIETSS